LSKNTASPLAGEPQITGACFRRLRRRGNPPAKIQKGGGAAPLKTAKEPGEKHRLEPYFNFGGRKFLII